jgi:DNA polymerase-3 subunit delta'
MSWDLLGHAWAEKLLQKHIASGEVRHAYLFTGAPGIGRRSLALAFARAINCTQPPSPGEYCGTCRVCRQTEKMQQADLSIVTPEVEGGMIKVSQVRSLQRSLALTPYEARYRIALLLNFQAANASAQNALLKTLEEAPQQVILLLTADSVDTLLPTISSRCEILRLRPVSVQQLEKELRTRWHLSEESARLYAHIANGRTGLALQMAQSPDILEKRKTWADEFFRLLPLNRRERFAAVDALTRNRETLRIILQVWLSLARDLLLAVNGLEGQMTNLDYRSEMAALVGSLSSGQALDMVNHIINSLENLESNANLRLLLDNLLLEFPQI